MYNPFANFQQSMQMLNEFSQGIQGNPRDIVQQKLNSGDMTQEQLNSIIPMAQRFYQAVQAMGFGRRQ